MSDPDVESLTQEFAFDTLRESETPVSRVPPHCTNDDSSLAETQVLENDSTQPTAKNLFNLARLTSYRSQFSRQFLDVIREADLEYGFDSAVDLFLRERLAENALATKEWLNSLFIEHFADPQSASGILRAIAHLGYHEIAPQGPTMALAALSHSSLEVRECGVRAFENWGTLESLQILKSLRFSEDWMANYARQVISDLEERYLGVPAS